MKKTKQMLAFEQLEAEMEIISTKEAHFILGGAGEPPGTASWFQSITSITNQAASFFYISPLGDSFSVNSYVTNSYGSTGNNSIITHEIDVNNTTGVSSTYNLNLGGLSFGYGNGIFQIGYQSSTGSFWNFEINSSEGLIFKSGQTSGVATSGNSYSFSPGGGTLMVIIGGILYAYPVMTSGTLGSPINLGLAF